MIKTLFMITARCIDRLSVEKVWLNEPFFPIS